MMEIPVASLVPSFGQMGVTGYSVNMEFNGTSVYWGIQAGVSYEITKNISVFAGARFIMAKNTYTGYIKDITLKFDDDPANDMRADDFMNSTADQAQYGSEIATGAATLMEPIIEGGGGPLQYVMEPLLLEFLD